MSSNIEYLSDCNYTQGTQPPLEEIGDSRQATPLDNDGTNKLNGIGATQSQPAAESLGVKDWAEQVKLRKQLLSDTKARCNKALRHLNEPGTTGSQLTTARVDLTDSYAKLYKSIVIIESSIRNAEKEYTLAADTEWAKSMSEWARVARKLFSPLINVLSALCLAGTGLTYSSIFSAARGNVGLTSWSFSLFIVSLSILLAVQCLIMWAGNLTTVKPRTPAHWRFWQSFLIASLYTAIAVVVAAITLLVVSVLDLTHHAVPESSASGNSGNGFQLDPHISNKYPAIFALCFMATALLSLIITLAVSYFVYGVRGILWNRIELVESHPLSV